MSKCIYEPPPSTHTMCELLGGGVTVESNSRYTVLVYVDIYLCMVVNDIIYVYYHYGIH